MLGGENSGARSFLLYIILLIAGLSSLISRSAKARRSCNLFISTWLARSQSTFSSAWSGDPFVRLPRFASICSSHRWIR